jgi:glyoxylate reductase
MDAQTRCDRVRDKDAIICMFDEPIDRRLMDVGSRLKVIATVAVGYNNIDGRRARARAGLSSPTRRTLTESVADFTWALILGITRRLAEGDRLIRRGAWRGWSFDFMLGTELRGKQLGLVGAGRIGRAVASRAPAFGVRVAYAAYRGASIEDAQRRRRSAADPDIVSPRR